MRNKGESQGTIEVHKERKRKLGNYLQRKAIRDYVKALGGIGLPSKMPGTSYGISAKRCGVGGKLAARPGSVCFKCYAMRHNYTYPSVMSAQERRLESMRNWEEWVVNWGNVFTYLGALMDDGERFHRWHDSGDVQSAEHLGAIVEVARRNPEWRFWLPTKEYGIVRKFKAQWDIPSNLVIRVSAPMLNEAANEATRNITGHTSTVGSGEGRQCPASKQEGFCGDCRACWDESVANVDYVQH